MNTVDLREAVILLAQQTTWSYTTCLDFSECELLDWLDTCKRLQHRQQEHINKTERR